MATPGGLRLSAQLGIPIVGLATIASATGLLHGGLYRDPAAVVHAIRGQDFITLLIMPVATAVLASLPRPRAVLIWYALLGYVLYTYTGAAFGYYLNPFFLVYIALVSLTVFSLGAALAGTDAPAIAASFDEGTPRRAVGVFLACVGLVIAIPELAQIGAYMQTGVVPELITRAGTVTSFVYVLDLGIIAPLMGVAAVWLWRGRPWGFVLSAVLLVKCAAMGLALISMAVFSARAGFPDAPAFTAAYGAIALSGVLMSAWFLRHCARDLRAAHGLRV